MNPEGLSINGKLLSGEQLLQQLFDDASRPSMRWLRTQTKNKSIPYIRIGHLVFFDLEMVRNSLANKRLVWISHSRLSRPTPPK